MLTMKLNSMYSNGDTTVIVFEKYSFEKFKKSTIHDFLYVRDTLYCIGEKKIRKLDSKRVVENSKLVNELYFKSCKIFEKNNLIAKTGLWTEECIVDDYIEYYKTGKIKIKGYYSKNSAWQKKGVWEYYNIDGTLNKKIVYDENGKILKPKK